jgi:hypothetical protein
MAYIADDQIAIQHGVRPIFHHDARAMEDDVRIFFDVEEIGRLQMTVSLIIARTQAGHVNLHRDDRVGRTVSSKSIVPLKDRNWPRTFEIIKCRAEK